MKVLLTNAHSGAQTGSGTQLYLLARELVQRGHCITAAFKKKPCASTPHHTLAKLRDAGIGLVRIPFAKLKYSYTIPALVETGRWLRDENFDVIHAFSGKDLDYMFILSWFLRPTPLIANRGVTTPLDVFNSIKYRSSRVTRIVAVADEVKQVMVKSGRIPPDKIDVVYSAADLSVFDPAIDGRAVRTELGLPLDAPVVGVFGSLTFVPGHMKGGMELLTAARSILVAHPNTRFLMVGSVIRELFDRAADPAIASRFIFTGFREDVPRMMAACEMIVSSSIKTEGLASVLREALAMKKPVVATDVGGNRELVIPDETGVLVPPSDSAALARAVNALIDDPARRAALAEAGRRRVEERFALPVRVEQVERLYYRALETRAPRWAERPGSKAAAVAPRPARYLSFDYPASIPR